MTEGAFVAARFALMIDLAMLMGLPLFWWVMGMAGRPRHVAALALGGLALSAFWLLASTATMTGAPILPPDWSTLHIVLTMTPIGTVLAVRGGALLLVLAFIVAGRVRLSLLPAAVAAATLAWTGHASATEDMAGQVHRAADVAHIWAASAWIGALAILLRSLLTHHPTTANMRHVARMLSRFAVMGSLIVVSLVLSGAVNAVIIVGLDQLPAMVQARYGLLLTIKLLLFGLMLLLAAANRWWLTPRLEGGNDQQAIGWLRLSLALETSTAVAIVALVAWLGTLDPLA
ncbi:copper homeostasis membrane protein CopD [Sphingobium abikonense]|uniref:copper homeostasis membrane protein CopD n=1 Tax=Sphingobium abikonense TaxID=86193 RepID=UPI0035194630